MGRKVARLLVALWVAVLLAATVGCERREAKEISLKDTKRLGSRPLDQRGAPLRIAMGAMITPKEGFFYYEKMKRYIEGELGRPVQLIDRDNYGEVNQLLESGGADAAFICAGPYVEGRVRFGIELLAMPLVNGVPQYYSYIIVHKDSKMRALSDLRGKSFAFSDPGSNPGKIVPTYLLSLMNETPDTFFKKYIYTYSHDKSVRVVAEKLADGAAVDSLIFDYLARNDPEYTSQVKIIQKSLPHGIPPVVVRPNLPAETKQRLRKTFLHMHESPIGGAILAGMNIDKFVAGDDRNYDSIRQMQRLIDQQERKKR